MFFQNTFLFGGFIAYKFRNILDIFVKDDYKIKEYQPKSDYIPDNEASIIHSIKSLYNLNPHMMLYKVSMKHGH